MLQCVAVCCGVLQLVAVCSVLHLVTKATSRCLVLLTQDSFAKERRSVMQRVAVWLQCVAVCCSGARLRVLA